MFGQAKDNAASAACSALRSLDIPSLRLDGVNLVDPATPSMGEYLKMTWSHAGLYGDGPYEVGGADRPYLLRQTSCFGKFSACKSRPLAAGSLPLALFEISDSFRREPEDTLQLSYRLRRFHLPEAHIHGRDLRDAVDMSLPLHRHILGILSELDAELVLLINATYEFAAANHDYLKLLAAEAHSPAMLKVAPPGTMCEDGVEVDVEYKVVDSAGYCRELSTFQIDEQITRSFGIRCDDGTVPSTIHSAFSGGVERYLYLALDRIVRYEAAGVRRHLPLWLTPVVARVVPADAAAIRSALAVATRLSNSGVRSELDDRGRGLASAIADADSLLVPYVVLVDADLPAAGHVVQVRDFGSGLFRDRDIRELIAEIDSRGRRPGADGFQRLSRQHFNVLGAS
jgi:threonyl-tRNA synthetase